MTGCSTKTAQYFGESTNSSMKMTHHTKILNGQTRRLTDTIAKSLSDVNFEYEEIITQLK